MMLYMVAFLSGWVLGVLCTAASIAGCLRCDDPDPQPLGEAVGGSIEFTDP